MDDNSTEHDLHVLTVDDYNERGSYGTILLCSCGERVGIDGDSWEYADTLACMHLGYYDVPRPDIIDEVFAQVRADAAIVAAAKAWGVACRTRSEGIAVDEVDLGARAAAARTLHTLLELVDPGKET